MLGAVNQAVQRAPYFPESHNLKGLACEARLDNQSAIHSYLNALYALDAFCRPAADSQIADVSINLARSLCKVKFWEKNVLRTRSRSHELNYSYVHIILALRCQYMHNYFFECRQVGPLMLNKCVII